VRLVSFQRNSAPQLGALIGQEVVCLGSGDSRLPSDVCAILKGGDEAMEAAGLAVQKSKVRYPLADVRLCAPVPRPRKFLGLGFSYASHVQEIKDAGIPLEIPDNQVWFNKQVTCITGPYDPIHLPQISDKFDYEGELTVVIGRACRHVRAADAHKVIAGYMVTNDLSIRDWQMRSPTATLGKSFDTHGPIGPWLTTPEEIGHPENLRVQTWVDEELRQDGRTDDFIYSIGEMIEELTTVFTLEPGDILATGTPSGVGAAFRPPRFLEIGQTVRVEIEGLGHIANTVIAEPDNTYGG